MTDRIIEFSLNAYTGLLPFAWIALGVIIVILLPLAIFKRTRRFSGTIIFYASYLFGLTTWFLGAAITLSTWGWLALIIGFFLAGVGVVPIGILASFITLKSASLGISIIVMGIVTYACRMGGVALSVHDSDEYEKEFDKIHFRCQNCGAKYSASTEQVGKEGKCKKCGERLIVPDMGDFDLEEDPDVDKL